MTHAAAGAPRLIALDWIRGVGAAFFILWHSIDYFFAGEIADLPLGRAIFFTTGLFVFAAGFLLGFHSFSSDAAPSFAARRRLALRGGKLLALFLGAKVVFLTMKRGIPDLSGLSQGFSDSFSLLYKDRWDQPLQVLAVLGLLIIVAPYLYPLVARPRRAAAVFCLVGVGVLEFAAGGSLPYLWRYLAAGAAGLVAGGAVEEARVSAKTAWALWAACLAVLVGLCAVAVSDAELYERLLKGTLANGVASAAVFAVLGIPAHLVWGRYAPPGPVAGVCLMGEMSLFVYLLQIVVIKAAAGRWMPVSSNPASVLIAGSAVWLICLTACFIVRRLRSRPMVDRLYRALFQ